jgi:hypothetical protein
MNTLEKTMLLIIREYRKFMEFIDTNNFDHSDWYNSDKELIQHLMSSGCWEDLRDDLKTLCEDNEVLATAIKEYFSENQCEKVD